MSWYHAWFSRKHGSVTKSPCPRVATSTGSSSKTPPQSNHSSQAPVSHLFTLVEDSIIFQETCSDCCCINLPASKPYTGFSLCLECSFHISRAQFLQVCVQMSSIKGVNPDTLCKKTPSVLSTALLCSLYSIHHYLTWHMFIFSFIINTRMLNSTRMLNFTRAQIFYSILFTVVSFLEWMVPSTQYVFNKYLFYDIELTNVQVK